MFIRDSNKMPLNLPPTSHPQIKNGRKKIKWKEENNGERTDGETKRNAVRWRDNEEEGKPGKNGCKKERKYEIMWLTIKYTVHDCKLITQICCIHLLVCVAVLMLDSWDLSLLYVAEPTWHPACIQTYLYVLQEVTSSPICKQQT